MQLQPIHDIDVSRETLQALNVFADDVLHWTTRINLVAPTTREELWRRHIADSAQLFPLVPLGAGTWCDIGSGGGFPAIVLAIISRESLPQLRFSLIESDKRKAAFLLLEIAKLNLNAEIFSSRAELIPPLRSDVVSARALSSLSKALPMVHRHLSSAGTALLHKGRAYSGEIADAQRNWSFDVECVDGLIDGEARILKIRHITRKKAIG